MCDMSAIRHGYNGHRHWRCNTHLAHGRIELIKATRTTLLVIPVDLRLGNTVELNTYFASPENNLQEVAS